MVKSKKGSSLHSALQNAVVAAINDPSYAFALPGLSDWESVVSCTAAEKERLEFVGDAVMHLSVALYLYQLFPDAAPGLYTNIRSAVNTNATFTHLMIKIGAYKLPSQSQSTKAAADSFEVIVAALYMERGFGDVCAWVQEQYAPLIAAARKSYDECISTKHSHSNPFWPAKRSRNVFEPSSTPLLKKIRLSSGRSTPRSTLMAQRVINRMKSKGKVKLCLPAKKSKLPLEMRLRSCEMSTPGPQMPPPPVIDLTLDSDDDEAPSPVAQAPQASLKPPPSTSHAHRSGLAIPSKAPPSQSYSAHQTHQEPYKSFTFHWPPREGAMTGSSSAQSRRPSSPCLSPPPPSPSPCLPRPIANLPARARSAVPRPTFELFKRSGLSLPQQPNNIHTHLASGTHENPIVIGDSDTEDT